MRLFEALERWAAGKESELSTPSAVTLRAYMREWRKEFGDVDLRRVTPARVDRYKNRRSQGRSAASLNRERGLLRQFFRWAEELGLCENPVTTWRTRAERVKREYHALTKEQEGALVMQLGGVLARWVRFATATGLRAGTIRRLRWEHVRDGALVIPGELIKQRRPLRMVLSRRAKETLVRGGSEFLFDLPSDDVIRRRLRRAGEAIGIEGLTPHDLRRTWVFRMREAGADMYDVQRIGGWSTPGSLLRHYFTGVSDAKARRYLEAL